MINSYLKYRGKCKQYVDEAISNDPTLTAIRGHYNCPLWGLQNHWWCVRKDGTIYDPTVTQFPSAGVGEYIPFNGLITCETCGKRVPEEECYPMGNYACCSYRCAMRLVGI